MFGNAIASDRFSVETIVYSVWLSLYMIMTRLSGKLLSRRSCTAKERQGIISIASFAAALVISGVSCGVSGRELYVDSAHYRELGPILSFLSVLVLPR